MRFPSMQSRPVWGTLAVARPIRRSIPRTGLSPVMAAEQFLPPGKFETVSVVGTTFGSHPGEGEHRHSRRRDVALTQRTGLWPWSWAWP